MIVDFEYNGELASDYGLIMCQIETTSGTEIVSAGAEINFNQTPIRNGNLFLTTDVSYDAPIEKVFQVCKYDCDFGTFKPLTLDERRSITRWLNTKRPCKLRLIDDSDRSYDYIFFEGMFNLKAILSNDIFIGYELTFKSNRPYAIGDTIIEMITASTSNYEYNLFDDSDEVGYIYPKKITITLLSDASELKIYNYTNDKKSCRVTKIKNCVSGEVITFTDKLTISTSKRNHENTIQDDFNFCFFRIENSYSDRLNRIVVSSPCIIKIEYNPVVKGVGM